jgi:glutathione S-transferase
MASAVADMSQRGTITSPHQQIIRAQFLRLRLTGIALIANTSHLEENMTFQYVSVDEAIKRSGVRMVVVGGVPSPWGEAAKGILHIKNIEWAAVRLLYDSEPLRTWAGQRSGPILMYNNERPRAGWAEILLLSERLAPNPSLLPKDAADRTLVFGLAHEICGEQGLAWSRRLQLIHAGLNDMGGFPERVSEYLGKKYGYSPEAGPNSGSRAADVLRMLASRLKEQRQAGSRYYIGDTLTAADIYSATCMAMFAPLPPSNARWTGQRAPRSSRAIHSSKPPWIQS